MAVYDFFVSRNSSLVSTADYVGHAGRLFYDDINGVVKLSDGITPGGTPIPYTIATETIVGGIKAGPGANVAADGTLTIDTSGLPLGVGNVSIVDTTLSTVNPDADLILATNGDGNVKLVGNVRFYSTAEGALGSQYFMAVEDGQVTFYTPTSDPLAGAVNIIGSLTGQASPPVNTGVMLQITGNNNDASRIYNDSIGSFSAYVGRRINGTVASPTAVQAGDEIIRISSTGYNGTTIPGAGSARIVFQAKENYTASTQGSNLSIWTTAVGSNVLVKTATFDRETGLTVSGNINVSGSIVGNTSTTSATIGALNVSGNIAFNANVNNATANGFNKTGGTVTANGRTGQITSLADSLAKGAAGTFTLNNNYIGSSKDVVVLNIASGASINSYSVAITAVNTGYCNVTVTNNGVGSLAEALVFNFAVIKVI